MWVLGEEAATNVLLGAAGQEAWPLWPELPVRRRRPPLIGFCLLVDTLRS